MTSKWLTLVGSLAVVLGIGCIVAGYIHSGGSIAALLVALPCGWWMAWVNRQIAMDRWYA